MRDVKTVEFDGRKVGYRQLSLREFDMCGMMAMASITNGVALYHAICAECFSAAVVSLDGIDMSADEVLAQLAGGNIEKRTLYRTIIGQAARTYAEEVPVPFVVRSSPAPTGISSGPSAPESPPEETAPAKPPPKKKATAKANGKR